MLTLVSEIIDVIQSRLSVTGCRRRNPTRADLLGTSHEHLRKFSKHNSQIPAQAAHNGKKRSCLDRSNDSTDVSTDASDAEISSQTPSSESQEKTVQSRVPWRPSAPAPRDPASKRNAPPGFAPPPGLAAPEYGKSLSKGFSSLPKGPMQRNPPATMETIRREMLTDIMGKLESEDAAILKGLFDARQSAATRDVPVRNGFHDLAQQQRSRMPSFRQNNSNTSVPAELALGPSDNSLRANLRKLDRIDEKRIVYVKKISKLGLNSPQLLEKYFSQFGTVEEVLCTHAIDRRCESGRPRVRPTNTGFVVMEKIEDASAAVRHGTEQVVSGVSVCVGPYQHIGAGEKRSEDVPSSKRDEQNLSKSERW